MTAVSLFDIDGTLTPPHQAMVPELEPVLLDYCASRPVYLVTGSDFSKVCHKLPATIRDAVAGIFCCSGSEFWVGNEPVFRQDHEFPAHLLSYVEKFIEHSPYPVRTGRHIETRTGMLNVSVVGREASVDQRQAYADWDLACEERKRFCETFFRLFPGYEAVLGGQISMDIVPRGWTKARVASEILERHPGASIRFYGDRIMPGGNDLPLAEVLESLSGDHQVIPVTDWEDTLSRLLQRSAMPASATGQMEQVVG